MNCSTSAILAFVSFCGVAAAQTYEQGGATIRFQVFDPAANGGAGLWTSTRTAFPGQQVEWRVVVSYTGTRTDLFALGEARYQPTVSNADNVGTGAAVDQIGAWRNGGNSGNGLPGSMLSTAEGENGAPLATYGRVNYGGVAANVATNNGHTLFRHTAGSDGAPTGNWLRIAGSFVSQWPRELNFPIPPLDVTANDINRILLGTAALQVSQSLDGAHHTAGTQNLVVLRQALIMSNATSTRTVQISSFRESFGRVGGVSGADEGDDRRYIAWQTGPSDNWGHRTIEPVIIPATITFIPSPGAVGVLGAVGFVCARRRRGLVVQGVGS